ncbi:MAG TPA: thioredoxin-disulfide reductase [Firmicutes bacterium]|nr:thioredoxin-disulfide reductase [Bacillota bacterium]
MNVYDVVIVGGGPAGLTAGIYVARSKLKAILLEKGLPGGQIATTEHIENYPGYTAGAGYELTAIMEEQAKGFGLEIAMAEGTGVQLGGPEKIITTNQGEYRARTVILAPGSSPRKLDVPGEKEFIGRGVSYCATCDGPFYEGLTVMVVGGGNAAVEEANYLTRFAQKVYIVHRRDALRATKVVQERAFANEKIEILWDSVVAEIRGNETLEQVLIKNVKTGQITPVTVDGLFVYIGFIPNTAFLKGQVEMDEAGYIITNDRMETSVPGVFAAGDCRQKLLRQVVTAAGDGAIAAFAAEKYLEEQQ